MTSTARPLVDASTIYEENRPYVLGVLGHRCSWLDPSDREALLHDAFAVFLEKQRSGQLDTEVMSAPQLRAYLTQTALNKAMDEGKRAWRRRSVSLDDENLGIDPVDPGREIGDRLAASFDDARIREIVSELPERQQAIIKLRFFMERTPDEIQRHMGVTERVYRRELERATRHIAERAELVRNGQFCESRRSLILAYVTGVAGPGRMADARRHLMSCPGCASWARELRLTLDRGAAIIPLPTVGGISLVATSSHHFAVDRLLGVPRRLLDRGFGAVTRARAHAVDIGSRLDPSTTPALAGVRPGATAIAVASCLAVGSGATYCVVDGFPPPIRALIGAESPRVVRPRHRHHWRKPTSSVISATTTTTTASVVSSAPPSTTRTTATRSTTTTRTATATTSSIRPSSTRAAAVHKSTAPEFGVGTGAPVATPNSGSGASTSAPPPPKPSKHLSEFDP